MKAETFFYLVTRGRNTRLPRRRETWFVEMDGTFYLLAESGDQPDWVRNVQADPDVAFSIGNRKNVTSHLGETQGRGRVLDESHEPDLCTRVRASMHAKYRWSGGLIIEVAVASGA